LAAASFCWLSSVHCPHCAGEGQLPDKRFRSPRERGICKCVARTVFRLCLKKFRQLDDRGQQDIHWARAAEFRADFESITRPRDSFLDALIFRRYFILDLPWKAVVRQTGYSKYGVYRRLETLEIHAGRAILATQPHSVFPVDRYFGRQYPSRASLTWMPEAWNDRTEGGIGFSRRPKKSRLKAA
jgi:hypothetical protein